jgi:hypothetical protein
VSTGAVFNAYGSVDLNYNNVNKLATTATGIDVTGTISDADGNVRSGRKNLLINGGFDVWQRGTSFSSPATAKYTADRWKVMGTVTTVSKVTNGLSITATSSDSFMQDIEAMNVKAGNYIFSFTADDYSKITNIGCYSMGGGTHYGYATKLSDGVYSINLAEINRAGSSIRFEFYLAVGTVVLSQVQLELGSVATDFEHRSYGEELALCQRYYQRINNTSLTTAVCNLANWDGGTWYGVIDLTVQMRGVPTGSKYSGTQLNVFDSGSVRATTSITLPTNESNTNQVEIYMSAGTNTNSAAWARFKENGVGWLAWSAEL